MADYYLHKTAAHIDELLEKVEGLDNYDDTEVRGLINNKVDKETGKGLSTNDFTDAYKETLDGIDTALDSKVDKVTGKGLSTNDFTNAYKAAVDGAAPQATTYTDTEVDALLTEKADADDVYTKQQVDDAINSKESISVSVVGDSLIFLIN